MLKGDFAKKSSQLKELKEKNRIKFKWQDTALKIIEELSLPRYVQTAKDKKPLDVRAIIMRHAKLSSAVLERRFALVKEHGLSGEQAVLYYLGIVEKESAKN